MMEIEQKNNISQAELLFRLFAFLLVLSIVIIILVNPLGNQAPSFERNIFNNIVTFAALLAIVSMELTTIYYYKRQIPKKEGVE